MPEITEDQLVFIISTPRSGSTLLSALLGNHPEVYSPAEPWLLLRLSDLVGPPASNRIYDDDIAHIALRDFLPQDLFLKSARTFALGVYAHHLEAAKARLFVDKTPRYYHILPFIRSLFPGARMIWLKRNPLDVAASIKREWKRGMPTLTGDVWEPVSYDTWYALDHIRQFFDHNPENTFELCYEELVQNPEATLQSLSRFCGISYSNDMLQLGSNSPGVNALAKGHLGDPKIHQTATLHSGSIGAWHQVFTAAEQTTLVDLLGPDMFNRMGYQDLIKDHPQLFQDRISLEERQQIKARLVNKGAALRATLMSQIYRMEQELTQRADINRAIQTIQSSQDALKTTCHAISGSLTATSEYQAACLHELSEKSSALAQTILNTQNQDNQRQTERIAHVQEQVSQDHTALLAQVARLEAQLDRKQMLHEAVTELGISNRNLHAECINLSNELSETRRESQVLLDRCRELERRLPNRIIQNLNRFFTKK